LQRYWTKQRTPIEPHQLSHGRQRTQRLAEVQSHFPNALIDCDVGQIAPILVGGREPEKHLAIHQRNYETSLVDALLAKFPATGWLIGAPFLTETAPNQLELAPAEVWIEVRGARGEFQLNRLDADDFIFRKSALESRLIGEAAEFALDVDETFDPGQALAALLAGGFVVQVS
jgi:hypothetical protein